MTDSVRPLVAGNWKMNGSRTTTRDLIAALAASLVHEGGAPCDIVVCPPSPYLADAAGALASVSGIWLGAQDCHIAASGAHTGDVSAAMLADLGCGYAIVGHSERRGDHGEDSATVRAKGEAAIAAGLNPIVCVGETEADRDAGRAVDVVGSQLEASLPDGAKASDTVIAYEPVWAIGTGRTPEPGGDRRDPRPYPGAAEPAPRRRRRRPYPLWRFGQAGERRRHIGNSGRQRRPGRRRKPRCRRFLVDMSIMSVAIRGQ